MPGQQSTEKQDPSLHKYNTSNTTNTLKVQVKGSSIKRRKTLKIIEKSFTEEP